jgi:hypothetical protein
MKKSVVLVRKNRGSKSNVKETMTREIDLVYWIASVFLIIYTQYHSKKMNVKHVLGVGPFIKGSTPN